MLRHLSLRKKISLLDKTILFPVFILCIISVAVLYSAGNGDFSKWASKQLIRSVIGGLVMLGIAFSPWTLWRGFSYTAYILSILLLLYVDVFGHIGMGAQRWINLYVFYLQPSEVVKITLVLALARYYSSPHIETQTVKNHLLPILLFVGLPLALVLRQPDLGTALILCMVGISIVFMMGLHWGYFVFSGASILIAAPFLWNRLYEYQQKRILTFLNPENDPLGAGYHLMQSKIAIGSAGFFGKGFLNGSQAQLDFLPEKQTDFIFTTFTEEFGILGALALIFLYFYLLYHCSRIAMRLNQPFPRLMVAGITITSFLYIFINIGMVMGIAPVVGVPLPLLTYGGTATLSMMINMGLVLSADLYQKIKASSVF